MPDEQMGRILERLKHLRFLSDPMGGQRDVSLYVDDKEGTFWESSQSEPGVSRLQRVSRRYIEERYPQVDLDWLMRLMP